MLKPFAVLLLVQVATYCAAQAIPPNNQESTNFILVIRWTAVLFSTVKSQRRLHRSR
jgi:hypothetical protein